MPVKSIKNPGFVYMIYWRECPKDFIYFRTEVLNFAKAKKNSDDIVVDATKSNGFNELEIGLLAEVLRTLRETTRTLRLIMSKPIYDKLNSMNFFKADNIAAYNNHEEYYAYVNKMRLHEKE